MPMFEGLASMLGTIDARPLGILLFRPVGPFQLLDPTIKNLFPLKIKKINILGFIWKPSTGQVELWTSLNSVSYRGGSRKE